MSIAQRFFWIGCGLEAALCVLALGLSPFLPLDLHWNGEDLLLGLTATLPAIGLFLFTVHASGGPLGRLRKFLDTAVRPLFDGWSIWQLLLISLLAGLGEELLFRGIIQGSLSRWLGVVPGLILASLFFGLCHPMTLSYLVVTSFLGAYLGALWLLSDNLLAPIVTHALYDFLALVYFLRYRKP